MILQLQEYEDQRIRNTKRRRVSRLLPNIVSRMRGAGMLAFVPYSRRGRQLTRWDFEIRTTERLWETVLCSLPAIRGSLGPC